MNAKAQDEISAYVEGVHAALAGLPDSLRLDLLEDLPQHLAEVLAEGQGTLTERLGTPAAYAAELLSSAGFVGGFPDPPPRREQPLLVMRADLVRLLNRVDVRTGPVIGYARASDFLALLRPAWWIVRGYLTAMAITFILDDTDGGPGLLPRIGGSDVLALLLLAACVVGSIVLGRRALPLPRWPRFALGAATMFLVLFAISGFFTADGRVRDAGYSPVGSYDGNPYSNVQDVFVYDGNGRLVEGARLFDQDGSPIQLGNGWCTDPAGEVEHSRNLGYPYCPGHAPFALPSASANGPASAEPPRVLPSSAHPPATPSSAAPAPSPTPSGR